MQTSKSNSLREAQMMISTTATLVKATALIQASKTNLTIWSDVQYCTSRFAYSSSSRYSSLRESSRRECKKITMRPDTPCQTGSVVGLARTPHLMCLLQNKKRMDHLITKHKRLRAPKDGSLTSQELRCLFFLSYTLSLTKQG